jgi:formate hydrogenlyase subunit 3/multisubunit Na+/H+ antiporter MnhD subunit
MSEHQKQTLFLRECLLYDDTADRHKLEEKITQIQNDERCVRRAMWLMALFAALAIAGLCYCVIFLLDYPLSMSQLFTHFTAKVFCVLGLGSLISLMAFVGVGAVHRSKLDQRREECRRLARKLMESRLGKPRALKDTATETLPQESKT